MNVCGPWRVVVSVAVLCVCGASEAQTTVHRCGPDGRQYSQLPCPGGTTFDAADPRDAQQRAQARQLADLERARATRLERERLASEAAHRPAPAVGLDVHRAAVPVAAASRPTGKHRRKKATPPKTGDFIARNPEPARASRAP
ncbi:MAG: hypothetical protein ABIX46_13320 [Burkholderiaceae bacterium]